MEEHILLLRRRGGLQEEGILIYFYQHNLRWYFDKNFEVFRYFDIRLDLFYGECEIVIIQSSKAF